jgi:hypothetical protein
MTREITEIIDKIKRIDISLSELNVALKDQCAPNTLQLKRQRTTLIRDKDELGIKCRQLKLELKRENRKKDDSMLVQLIEIHKQQNDIFMELKNDIHSLLSEVKGIRRRLEFQ